MHSLFVETPLEYLQTRSDHLGNLYAFCRERQWVLLTNKPEEQVRIYLLDILTRYFNHISFKVEADRLDVSCYFKHPNDVPNFTYTFRPFTIWEVKRIYGPNFSDTLHQMTSYIEQRKLKYGAFFYNCQQMGYLDTSGNTIQITSIEQLMIILNEFIAEIAKQVAPIYQCYKKAINSTKEDIFNDIVELLNILNTSNSRILFKGRPKFHILVNGEERVLVDPEFECEKNCIIKYTTPDNLEFYPGYIEKLIAVT